MSDNKIKAYETIKNLVYKFESNYSQYNDINYNETMTRRDFIDPFFEALGWDVSNKQGFSETYRDVVHEDKLKIRESKNNVLRCKAPDYAFRIGGNRVFFVEAKKPFVKLDNNPETAFQLRRYGYSASLGVSILTDFEEIAIYDCSVKPNINDKSSVARIKYYNYKEYLNEEVFNFIYDTFARENIPRGSLEKYIADSKIKKGTSSVDSDFLNSLDNLRTKLADNINKLNKNLSVRDLNFAVQAIIDRIIFLRVAEDRNVEEYGRLRVICQNKSDSFYLKLIDVFRDADSKYNSGLFHLESDFITTNLQIDNKVIKEIIEELYYPISPYEFSVISVEIIGNAYEQFLGKTISINNRNKAVIDLKPEVRKAGGVYYTPEYIVDYIVRNSVGVMIEGKSPEEITKIKIIDPACGSGSFLLGVYQYLLDYHLDYYKNKKQNTKFRGVKDDVLNEGGDGLSLWLKKRILVNNIFGVDIDANAVEVSKLSLLLKCLEGETKASLINNASLFNERALPSLEDNIKCGNSLIGSDFYKNEEMLLLDEDMQYKINCFDFEDEFKEVFKNGSNGFDIVVGNPPYGAELVNYEREYLENKYSLRNTNTAALFLGLMKKILKDSGIGGYIIPKSFIYASNWESSRILMIKDLYELVDCSKVWKEVKLEQVITIFKNNIKQDTYITSIREGMNIQQVGNIKKTTFDDFGFYVNAVSNEELDIAYKMRESGLYLNDFITNRRGAPYQKFCIDDEPKNQKHYKVLGGKNISRYLFPDNSNKFILESDIVDDKAYIKENSILAQRIVSYTDIPKPSVIIRAISSNIINDKIKYVIVDTINQLTNISNLNTNFILAIVNSKLISWYTYRFIYARALMTMQFDNPVTSRIPMPSIDLENKKHKELHDKIVNFVEHIIELKNKINDVKNPNENKVIQRKIDAIEKNIDEIVYKLYNLNDSEIKVIEEA